MSRALLPAWLFLFLAHFILLDPCHAQGVITINEPWIRVAPGGRSAEAYMRVMSSDGATLVSAGSGAARWVGIVEPGGRNAVAGVPVPARGRVELTRGGYRIRLNDLHHVASLGARIPLVLTFRRNDGRLLEISADAEVRLHSPSEDESRPHLRHAH